MIFTAEQSDLIEIKKALRVTLPRVASSRLSEAIAMGLGYRTSRATHADLNRLLKFVIEHVNPHLIQ
jgi:hypothetical protein